MSLLHLIVVAVVQGLTEFLPISSSAHLILVPVIADWPDQGPTIDVAVHLGTLGAVMLYFRRDVVGYLLVVHGYIEQLRSPMVIAWATVVFGILLWVVDSRCMRFKRIQHLGFGAIIWIGLAQALALIPGTSRSGITITAARGLGYERKDAARISLLLSIPVILVAGGYQTLDLMQSAQVALGMDALIASILAFGAALLAMSLMMRWLQQMTFMPFVVYRLLLGGGLLYWIYV